MLGDVIPCRGCNNYTLPDAAYLHFEGKKLTNIRPKISFSIQPSKGAKQETTEHDFTIAFQKLPSVNAI